MILPFPFMIYKAVHHCCTFYLSLFFWASLVSSEVRRLEGGKRLTVRGALTPLATKPRTCPEVNTAAQQFAKNKASSARC